MPFLLIIAKYSINYQLMSTSQPGEGGPEHQLRPVRLSVQAVNELAGRLLVGLEAMSQDIEMARRGIVGVDDEPVPPKLQGILDIAAHNLAGAKPHLRELIALSKPRDKTADDASR
jgi:hypothetical protein